MEFYKSVFGGKLDLNTFEQAGITNPELKPDQIMHGMLVADNGITLMAADTATGMREYITGTNMSISLSGNNEQELTEYYCLIAHDT